MPTLLESYQKHLAAAIDGRDFVVMGENVDNGSRISGLGKNLDKLSRTRVLNVGNCELTHVGAGMGMMLEGGNMVLLVKQLDFLLLGLDQMVNTLNWIRANARNRGKPLGSFTIITYICDQGYQGPQSSLVDLSGFCSLGFFPGFILQEYHQIEAVLLREMNRPGFRIIGLPQKFASRPVLQENAAYVDEANGVRLYGTEAEICIVSCHSSFASAADLRGRLGEQGRRASILLSAIMPGADPSLALAKQPDLRSVIIMDDAKGAVKWGDYVARKCLTRFPDLKLHFYERSLPQGFGVQPDEVAWDHSELFQPLSTP